MTTTPAALERVYIGGFDPSRLTAKEVISRVETIPGIEVVVSDAKSPQKEQDEHNFCFVNVRKIVKPPKEEEDPKVSKPPPPLSLSAYELVAKQYHNVKWKGCKLSVERAKPSFLERLAEERQQIQQQKKEKEQQKLAFLEKGTTTTTTTTTATTTTATTTQVVQQQGSDSQNMVVAEDSKQPNTILQEDNSNINGKTALTSEHQQSKEEQTEESPTEQTQLSKGSTTPTKKIKIPRHLRIRQRYGKEAFHVDTKPTLVTEGKWSHFTKAVDQLQKKRSKYLEKSIQLQKDQKLKQRQNNNVMAVADQMALQPFLNRAVHLRFRNSDNNDDDNDIVGKRQPPPHMLVEDDEQASIVSSSASSSSSSNNDFDIVDHDSDAEENVSDQEDLVVDKKESNYEWSDDDDDNGDDDSDGSKEDKDDDDDDDDDDNSSIGGDGKTQKLSCTSKPSEYNDIHTNKIDDQQHDVTPKEEKDTKESYQWSSDEDSDESSVEGGVLENVTTTTTKTATTTKPLKSINTTDEFEAAMDLSDDEGNDAHDKFNDSEDNSATTSDEANSDIDEEDDNEEDILQEDVQANLGILSSIFPDMASLSAKKVETKNKSGDSNDPTNSNGDEQQKDSSTRGSITQPGWEKSSSTSGFAASLGTMQRYDPTKESAQKYEVKPPTKVVQPSTTTKDEDDSVYSSEGTSDDSEEEVEMNDITTKDETVDQNDTKDTAVYEQNKLEDVFRQARESEGTSNFQLSTQFQTAETNDDASPEKDKDGGDGGFSFGFDVMSTNENESSAKSTNDNDQATAKEESGFSFSFDLGKNIEADVVENGVPKKANDDKEANDDDSDASSSVVSSDSEEQESKNMDIDTPKDTNAKQEQQGPPRERSWFVPTFSKDLLNKYVNNFYSLNEGKYMLDDWEGYQNDAKIQQQWEDERKKLTLDWKRKRKYASSRMNKRHKY